MKQSFYKPLGFLFLALGLVGIPLPVLPSTPFILLSAWFFARSSPRWHDWLISSELFGPMISNWEQNRCLSCRTKAVAMISMFIAGGASIIFALENNYLRIVTGMLLLLGGLTVLSIPTCASQSETGDTENNDSPDRRLL